MQCAAAIVVLIILGIMSAIKGADTTRQCAACRCWTMRWTHPRVDGGPDRRYKHNLFYCGGCGWVYGTPLPIEVQQANARREQERREQNEQLAAAAWSVVEFAGSAVALMGAGILLTLKGVVALPMITDNLLEAISGEGNTLIHGFLRVLVVVTVAAAILLGFAQAFDLLAS